MCVCAVSGFADRRVCQRVFLPPMSTVKQQRCVEGHCGHRAVPDFMEEVCTHTNSERLRAICVSNCVDVVKQKVIQ